jgi:signal transduction histidine kinase
MTIKKQLILSSGSLIVTLMLIGITVLFGYRYVTQKASLANDFDKETMYLQTMLRGINEAIINGSMKESIKTARRGFVGFDNIHSRLMSTVSDPDVKHILTSNVHPKWRIVKDNINPLFEEDPDLQSEEMMILSGWMINKTSDIIDDVQMLAEITRSVVNTNSKISEIIQSVIIFIIIVMIIVISYLSKRMYSSITRPITELTTIAEGFNRGDLSLAMDESRSDEFGALAAHFNSSTAKLRQINRELSDFAHIASHDLQEPLRKILAFGDRLKIQYSDALGEKGSDYIDRIQKAATRMQKLTNGLLMFSRVASKARPYEPVDLAQVVDNVVSDFEEHLERAGGTVEICELSTVNADPGQMQKLVQHLLDNALKYARENVPPEVRINGREISPDGNDAYGVNDTKLYQITVEDNGIGFEQQYSERIFGVFQRLHGKSEYEGAGIGLSICRRIVERHNGNITAKGIPGKGAEFIITLPITHNEGG